jgi:hypothetical protein
MIPVVLPAPPAHYQTKVRQPGLAFLAVTPNPTSNEWNQHRYWQEIHQDLYRWHKGVCVYSASWTPHPRHRGVDHTSIDHFVPKSKNRPLAYEWSNFRMVRSKLNNRKDNFEDVLDPCALQPGWFRLNFTTFFLEPATALPARAQRQVASTIQRLLLNGDPAYVNERARVIYRYAGGKMTFADIQKLYPFIAAEMQAQNFDVLFKPSVVTVLAKRPWLAN